MVKAYKLFIDDERFPTSNDCVIARSSEEAMAIVIKQGIPVDIMFDHDLGGDDTSRKFIHKLISHMLDNEILFPSRFTFSVHSQNPVGAEWIRSMMNNAVEAIGVEA